MRVALLLGASADMEDNKTNLDRPEHWGVDTKVNLARQDHWEEDIRAN